MINLNLIIEDLSKFDYYKNYKRNIKCGIYMIRNKVNDKVYIGQSVNIFHRLSCHVNTSKNINSKCYDYPLYRAFRKYSLRNFEFYLLEICDIKELNNREIFYIKNFNSVNNGYNQTEIYYDKLMSEVKLSVSDVEEITKLLLKNDRSIEYIAKKFDVHTNNIYYINNGLTFPRGNLNYPLRDAYSRKIVCNECKKSFIGHYSRLICDICENERKCIVCNESLSLSNSKYCSYKCSSLGNRKIDRPSKGELEGLIIRNSFIKIGEMYNVSGNSIVKWCKDYNLPYKKSDIKKIYKKELEKLHFDKYKVICKVCSKEFLPDKASFCYCSKSCYLENLKSHNLRNSVPSKNDIIEVMINCETFFDCCRHFKTDYTTMRRWCEKFSIPYNIKEFKSLFNN